MLTYSDVLPVIRAVTDSRMHLRVRMTSEEKGKFRTLCMGQYSSHINVANI